MRTGSSPTRHVSCKREQRLSPELPYRRTSREIYDRTTSCTSTSRTRLDRLAISCCFRAKAVRLRHHANVQGNAMSAQGAKARAINVLARRRAIRAQHGARHCIAHQGESMQGESWERFAPGWAQISARPPLRILSGTSSAWLHTALRITVPPTLHAHRAPCGRQKARTGPSRAAAAQVRREHPRIRRRPREGTPRGTYGASVACSNRRTGLVGKSAAQGQIAD